MVKEKTTVAQLYAQALAREAWLRSVASKLLKSEATPERALAKYLAGFSRGPCSGRASLGNAAPCRTYEDLRCLTHFKSIGSVKAKIPLRLLIYAISHTKLQ